MANTLQIRRGTGSPLATLSVGEPGWLTDSYLFYIGDGAANRWVGAEILDEDNMVSNSATKLATQQSIKAYVDAAASITDLDDLADVVITGVTDNEVLAYDSGSGNWINQTGEEANLVDKSSVQTISGAKTFSADVTWGAGADAVFSGSSNIVFPDESATALVMESSVGAEFITFQTSVGDLQLIFEQDVYLQANLVSFAAQAVSFYIKDNEAAALDFTEGANSYLSFKTTDLDEAVVITPTLELLATTAIDLSGIAGPEILLPDAAVTGLKVTDGVTDFMIISTGTDKITWATDQHYTSAFSTVLKDNTDNAWVLKDDTSGVNFIEVDTVTSARRVTFTQNVYFDAISVSEMYLDVSAQDTHINMKSSDADALDFTVGATVYLNFNTLTGIITIGDAIDLAMTGSGLIKMGASGQIWVNDIRDQAGVAAITINNDDVTIAGDLTVNGTTTTVNTDNLIVEDPLIFTANGNTSTTIDMGFIVNWGSPAVDKKHSGLVLDMTDNLWHIFLDLSESITSTATSIPTPSDWMDLKVGYLYADDGLRPYNPAGTFYYDIVGAAIVANRTLTIPLLTGNDTLVAESHTQTLDNKTIDGGTWV